jgi:cell fate (sporulation/competence/biofilm development) regulator YlbF (YheA/YmcA/DUF963 family)
MFTHAPSDPALEAATRAAEANALTAAGTLGSILRDTPEFAALLAADRALSEDAAALAAIEAVNTREAEWRVEISMGVLGASERGEIERLRAAMLACPSVAGYVAAQGAFGSLCREVASVASAEIGVDFAANCRTGGCCGG